MTMAGHLTEQNRLYTEHKSVLLRYDMPFCKNTYPKSLTVNTEATWLNVSSSEKIPYCLAHSDTLGFLQLVVVFVCQCPMRFLNLLPKFHDRHRLICHYIYFKQL